MKNKEELNEYELKWFDIVLQEYNSLRNECADSLKSQQSIINYGLTAIGVLIAFSANLWGKEQIVESIYVLFIPFICNLIILIWNGEVRRMSRAGQYIKRIEDKINKAFSGKISLTEPALEWETYLRKPKEKSEPSFKQKGISFKKILSSTVIIFSFLFQKGKEKNNKIKSNYIAIIVMIGGLSTLSILLGFGHNFSTFKEQSGIEGQQLFKHWITSEIWSLGIYAIIFILDLLFFVYHYRYFEKVKK